MKKFITLAIALVMVLSMTITASAYAQVEFDYELKGATGTAVDKDGEPCIDYFIYMSGDIETFSEAFEAYYILLNDVLPNPMVSPDMESPTLMGAYTTHVEFDSTAPEIGDVTYTITPQIAGFDENTTYQLFSWNRADDWDAVTSSVNGNSIEVTVETNGGDYFALLVDKDTLSQGEEPAQHGNQVLFMDINVNDGANNPIKGLGMIYRLEDDITEADLIFKTLFDNDLYYTMISSDDSGVNKDDLVILDKMNLLIFAKEYPVFPLTVTFEYDKVNENSKVYLLHDKRAEEEASPDWELIIPTVGNGTFIAEFSSFSPVVIYADATTLNGYVDNSTPLSPVTGDGDMNYIIFLGLIVLVSMGIVAKKINQ